MFFSGYDIESGHCGSKIIEICESIGIWELTLAIASEKASLAQRLSWTHYIFLIFTWAGTLDQQYEFTRDEYVQYRVESDLVSIYCMRLMTLQ